MFTRKRERETTQEDLQSEIDELRQKLKLSEQLRTDCLANIEMFQAEISDELHPSLRAIALSQQTKQEIKKNQNFKMRRGQYRVAKKHLEEKDFGSARKNTVVPVHGEALEAHEIAIINSVIVSQSYVSSDNQTTIGILKDKNYIFSGTHS
ncbi:MAG: hypothetical protein EZS28_049287 [Streblomastix strix]|uniref:Uncharacterized protein n=1 Tax=Streblomastix strix TaxID=222440 RepID=A0A5J4T9U2_9EUKA|nr:MAG: hypothetical protein EZS28_049287 [Streblomastix strix]